MRQIIRGPSTSVHTQTRLWGGSPALGERGMFRQKLVLLFRLRGVNFLHFHLMKTHYMLLLMPHNLLIILALEFGHASEFTRVTFNYSSDNFFNSCAYDLFIFSRSGVHLCKIPILLVGDLLL